MDQKLDKSLKSKKLAKMKISGAVIFALASADDRKVPPRHPLQRLTRLTEFSAEILNQWYSWLPSKNAWVAKFENNAARMERNFKRGEQKCGHYNEDQLPHGGPADRKRRSNDEWDRYDREDPAEGTKQITTGYRKWAERYISQCSGQRNNKFQVNRMARWNVLLQAHLLKNKNSQ